MHRSYLRTDREKANCLEACVLGSIWTAERAAPKEPAKQTCRRYKKAIETKIHRYYQCEDNRSIEDDSVKFSRKYEEEAIKNPEDPMWCRGITTGDKLNPPPCWIRLDQCIALMTPGFIKLVEKRGYVDTDGAGGKLSKAHKYRHVGAGAGVMIICPNGDIVIEAIWSMVPGKQTVPRSEGWGVYIYLRAWNTRPEGSEDIIITIIVDAIYIVNWVLTAKKSI